MTWNIAAANGYVQFDIDDSFYLEFDINIELIGANLGCTFDPAEYIHIGWDVGWKGYVYIDTNGDPVGNYTFNITKDAGGYHPKWGISVEAEGFAAEDYNLSWRVWPPSVKVSGKITSGRIISIDFCWKEKWYHVWPR